jgi:hypothetical protein
VALLDSGVADESFDGTGHTEIDGEWVRHETYLHLNQVGVANGTLIVATHRPTIGTPEINRADDFNGSTDLRDDSAPWDEWHFGAAYYDDCTGAETATIDVDEFYMDDTPQRVQICNASTWAATTHCELIFPAAWSGTSITAVILAGYFANDATVWVYVNDASNVPNSNGFEITLGTSSAHTRMPWRQ